MMKRLLSHRLWTVAATAGAVLLIACGGGGTQLLETASGTGASAGGTAGTAGTGSGGSGGAMATAYSWNLPAFFPLPKVPTDNPMNADKVELGRFLFYDVRLSGNGRQSCASCHHQDKAFSDGLVQPRGSTGDMHPRNAQHLTNVVFNATLTWANPGLVTLERQMETPLFGDNPVEMGVNDANKAEVLQRIQSDPAYPARFAKAFPGESNPIDWARIIKAIAAFQRTLLSGDSKYDRYLKGQERLTPAEDRGMKLYFGEKAECFHCHGSFNFNDQIVHAGSRLVETPFHNTGLFNIGGTGAFPEPNRGVFELTAKADDMGKFRAPSLRNVEVTAPYMHDGSMNSLEEVLRHYAAGGRVIANGPHAGDGRANPYKSDLVTLIDLNSQEQADIIAFLRTLTDHAFLRNPQFSNPHPAR